MIHYTIMPIEQIVEGMQEKQHYVELILGGVIMQVQPLDHYRVKIIRCISPNPQDYLNPKYAPGQLIHFSPSAMD